MFDFIRGKLDFVGPEYIVVENAGIGWQISTPNPFAYSSKIGTDVTVFVYHYVREDAMSLFGFSKREEKTLFTKLLSVSGIGPKGALAILAYGQPEQVVYAIEQEDEAFLIKFPGVGKKTARQMILDLKGKLKNITPSLFPDLFNQDGAGFVPAAGNSQLDEAILALKALGYTEKEVNKVSKELQKEDLSTDQYIKKALQRLIK
ncbi:ATP-dependent DNA helicase RuvA [Bacillus sp. FJAT-18017]|uniref:Holliday junction branch migration protein RuvA n=1 Tax=unclassified Bacillus (in: firmicutes) TaxID=185979 RepID=UPI0005C5F3D6|nr:MULTISPECIES: Holliday junction branch migration protein RuvA [unclassified Bacillus (in: firmicutes)]ALC89816.1 ATP-dependent DNA helicase RuvA [Bacillus sp. FJAT-18017]